MILNKNCLHMYLYFNYLFLSFIIRPRCKRLLTMSRPSSGYTSPTSSVFSRLPPIVTSESDRQFLRALNEYIEQELGKVDGDDDEQRYIVYKTAFNKVRTGTYCLFSSTITVVLYFITFYLS